MNGPSWLSQAPDEATAERVRAMVARIWEQHGALAFERVELIEQAVEALEQGELSDELRQEAQRAAHKLAGSLGIYGYEAASKIAERIEVLLLDPDFGPGQGARFAKLAGRLREALERPSATMKEDGRTG